MIQQRESYTHQTDNNVWHTINEYMSCLILVSTLTMFKTFKWHNTFIKFSIFFYKEKKSGGSSWAITSTVRPLKECKSIHVKE